MYYADIHFHGLWGVDDGAADENTSLEMIAKDYSDGVRILCLTPHYNPALFGKYDIGAVTERFLKLKEICKKEYPELELRLGNELCYHHEFSKGLSDGSCKALDNAGHVLVDFHGRESAYEIEKSLSNMLSYGYTPILAHAERYEGVYDDLRFLEGILEKGVLVQINAESVLSEKGKLIRPVCKLIKKGYVHFIASDAHDMQKRPPRLKECTEYLCKICDKGIIEDVLFNNAKEILSD